MLCDSYGVTFGVDRSRHSCAAVRNQCPSLERLSGSSEPTTHDATCTLSSVTAQGSVKPLTATAGLAETRDTSVDADHSGRACATAQDRKPSPGFYPSAGEAVTHKDARTEVIGILGPVVREGGRSPWARRLDHSNRRPQHSRGALATSPSMTKAMRKHLLASTPPARTPTPMTVLLLHRDRALTPVLLAPLGSTNSSRNSLSCAREGWAMEDS